MNTPLTMSTTIIYRESPPRLRSSTTRAICIARRVKTFVVQQLVKLVNSVINSSFRCFFADIKKTEDSSFSVSSANLERMDLLNDGEYHGILVQCK